MMRSLQHGRRAVPDSELYDNVPDPGYEQYTVVHPKRWIAFGFASYQRPPMKNEAEPWRNVLLVFMLRGSRRRQVAKVLDVTQTGEGVHLSVEYHLAQACETLWRPIDDPRVGLFYRLDANRDYFIPIEVFQTRTDNFRMETDWYIKTDRWWRRNEP